MTELLKYIISYCTDLYEKFGFKIVDSVATSSFGGNGMVILESDEIKLKFIRDREQMFLDFLSKYDTKKNNWYSLDLIRQLLTNEQKCHSLLNKDNGHFLKNNIARIIEIYKKPNAIATLQSLAILEKKRTKKMWG